MTTASLSPLLKQRFNDNNGNPLVSGQLFTYSAGTSTPVATYTSSTGGTANANPIILNSRGECDCWLLPNVGYKFVLQDSLGNTIWTEDNVVNGQLITLYGGVDTGAANAYILNFTANFSAYADGIVIYWVPANTNTGPSTINVNGLGVVNLVGPSGSALTAGQVVQNTPSVIMYKGGQFLLIQSGTQAFAAQGTFVGTLTGCTTSPTATFNYAIAGKLCTVMLNATLTATSNSTALTVAGLPALCQPATTSSVLATASLEDNTTPLLYGAAQVSSVSTITFYAAAVNGTRLQLNATGFTNSGTKGLLAGFSMSYLLT